MLQRALCEVVCLEFGRAEVKVKGVVGLLE